MSYSYVGLWQKAPKCLAKNHLYYNRLQSKLNGDGWGLMLSTASFGMYRVSLMKAQSNDDTGKVFGVNSHCIAPKTVTRSWNNQYIPVEKHNSSLL